MISVALTVDTENWEMYRRASARKGHTLLESEDATTEICRNFMASPDKERSWFFPPTYCFLKTLVTMVTVHNPKNFLRN